MKNKTFMKELRDYLFIALAMVLGAVGWVFFLLPNHITLGGLPGISSILYWGFGVPIQVTYFFCNLALLVVAIRILGWKFCLKTIYAVTMSTLSISVLQQFAANVTLLRDQPFMAAIVGASFMGISVGISLSCNSSTGGSDVVAAMINKYHDISLGNAIMMLDIVIVTSSFLVLGNWESVVYGYVVLFVSATCVDRVVNAMRRSVQFFIISDKYEQIGRAINTRADRGCTVINGQGFYSGSDVKMLFVLARQRESSTIFHIIDDIDPTAFVSQSAVIGVYGQGFDPFKKSRKKR